MCACLYDIVVAVFDFSLLLHGRMKLQGKASYGGCRAGIHSPTHVQCPGSPCHGQNIHSGLWM